MSSVCCCVDLTSSKMIMHMKSQDIVLLCDFIRDNLQNYKGIMSAFKNENCYKVIIKVNSIHEIVIVIGQWSSSSCCSYKFVIRKCNVGIHCVQVDLTMQFGKKCAC